VAVVKTKKTVARQYRDAQFDALMQAAQRMRVPPCQSFGDRLLAIFSVWDRSI
jgi:hypothetical protein